MRLLEDVKVSIGLISRKHENHDYFVVNRKQMKDPISGEKYTKVSITLKSEDLCQILQMICQIDELYEEEPTLPSEYLFQNLNALKHIKARYHRNPEHKAAIEALINFLDSEFENEAKKIEAMLKDGKISYHYLWYLFKKGDEALGYFDEEMIGGIVESTKYISSMFGGDSFLVNMKVVKVESGSFIEPNVDFKIPSFSGVKKVTDLVVRPLDKKSKKILTKRGELFAKIGTGANYLEYQGHVSYREFWNTRVYKADGRMMLDDASFGRMNPDYDRGHDRDEDEEPIKEMKAETFFMSWPFLKGFSFSCKQWGEFKVSGMTPIVFRDDSFDKLVLDEEKKVLIRALVENTEGTFQDIITGKGGGCIFLLHGPPGTGKTLSAESIAEILHRPLYSVSIGELGTNADALEKRLRQILEMAMIWNAVLLIDEADIFLEQRTKSDIERNAMVGIFLRLLEYHQGILFLTTNRVEEFDEAFHSRISIALKYKVLDQNAREQVWTNLFSAAGVDNKDLKPKELAKIEINGRQIKSTIRLAQALAKSEGIPINKTHIMRTVKITEQFKEDMKVNKD